MGFVRRSQVTITTDGSGDATAYIPEVNGAVHGIIYTKDDFAAGVDFTITAENTGEAILSLTDQNASGKWYPRAASHGVDGAATEYATGFPVELPIYLADDRVKIVVAQGGDTKSGTFDVLFFDCSGNRP